MSLYLDVKYLKLVSNRLPLFKQKNDYLYNCRCPICGDSATKKNKARGYFYNVKNSLMFKCHNCNASMHFGSLLKMLDNLQYDHYVMERYSNGVPKNQPLNNIEKAFTMKEPVFEKKPESLLDKILDRLDSLDDDHIAIQFCLKRKIPREKFNQIYFIDDIRKVDQLSDKYKDKISTSEPRIVFPFYNSTGQLTGITCRALGNETLRYVTIKIKEDEDLIFGIGDLNKEKTIYVVEGPIDSLFLPNSIAVSSTAFNKIKSLDLPKDKVVIIFDNQPRNREVVKLMNRIVDDDYSIVIWPQTLEEKDINDIVLADKDPLKIIKKNTFKGLEARANFIAWKRC